MTPFVFNDSNFHTFEIAPLVKGERLGTGLLERPREARYGSLPYATPYNESRMPLIDRKLIPEMVARIQDSGASPRDIMKARGILCKNQKQTNFCHAFSPALAMEYMYAIMGQPIVELSPASIAGPVTGFRNEGAWIGHDLQQIVRGGCATVEFVPATQVSRSGFKPGWEEDAAKRKVTEWWDLGSKHEFGLRTMEDRVMTCLLMGMPVCVGYHWWGHAVTLFAVLIVNGKLCFLGRNSWGAEWGDDGYFVFELGQKGTPDEAYALCSMLPSIVA